MCGSSSVDAYSTIINIDVQQIALKGQVVTTHKVVLKYVAWYAIDGHDDDPLWITEIGSPAGGAEVNVISNPPSTV